MSFPIFEYFNKIPDPRQIKSQLIAENRRMPDPSNEVNENENQ